MSLKAQFLVMALAVIPEVSYRILELECGSDFEIILLNFLSLCEEIEARGFLLKATLLVGSCMYSFTLLFFTELGS